MSNKFEIQVVALDKATGVFRRINNAMSSTMRPVTRAQRQFVALSREMHLDKIAKGLHVISHAGEKVASSLGLASGPMESIFGLGAAGGIVAAGSAIVALGAHWGELGFEVGRTSTAIGVSTDDLQRYRGAAKLAGVPIEAMTTTLATLGRTLQDAEFGRNPRAFQVLNGLGIGIKRNKDGVVDTVGTLKDLADVFQRMPDPHTRQLLAESLGITPETLPLLIQGGAALEKLMDQAQKMHLVLGKDGVESATHFQESLDRLKGSLEGVANTWGARIAPILTHGMDALTTKASGTGRGDFDWIGAALMAGGPLGASINSLLSVNGGAAPGRRSMSGVVTGAPGAGNLPIGLRLNNPGNLRRWGGADTEGGFARFGSAQEGLNAMAQQIGLYANRDGLRSISGIVSKYAPANENNTPAYIADVARQTGYDPNAQLDVNDPKVLAPLLSAMVKHEQGQQPFTPDQMTAAAQTVNVHVAVANAPAGTRVTTSGDGAAGAKVSYSLPMGDTP